MKNVLVKKEKEFNIALHDIHYCILKISAKCFQKIKTAQLQTSLILICDFPKILFYFEFFFIIKTDINTNMLE